MAQTVLRRHENAPKENHGAMRCAMEFPPRRIDGAWRTPMRGDGAHKKKIFAMAAGLLAAVAVSDLEDRDRPVAGQWSWRNWR